MVVPVKRLALAKSRLAAYGEAARQELALAFAADVVVAACEVALVLVVTDDDRAAEQLAVLGAEVAPDDPDSGLNPALEHGAAFLRARHDGLGVATLSADLPALRPEDLRGALAQVGTGARGFVSDHLGTGTTLLAAGAGAPLAPLFGPHSRRAHHRSGAYELVAATGLRRDVDTPEDLLAALGLGVGAHTRHAVRTMGLTTCQATVRTWERTGGTAFLDDGSVVPLPPECLRDSVFRFVRVGQRVRVVCQEGLVLRLGLP